MSTVTRRDAALRLGAALALAGLEPARAASGEAMLHRAIPASKSGESLPVIGMGTSGAFDVGDSAPAREGLAGVLRAFYAAGATVIDTAPMYRSAEAVVGDLMERLDSRPRTFLATKVLANGAAAGRAQVQRSLELLRSARLDLLQIHNLVDWRTQAALLDELKHTGVIRYTGITHYRTQAFADLEAALVAHRFDFVQFNYSIVTRAAEQRLLPLCRDQGIAVLVNRPFEDGSLFARVRGRALPAWAAEIGCDSWAQVFLKFILAQPAVTCVIPATSSLKHAEDNLRAGFGPLPDARLRERMAAEFA